MKGRKFLTLIIESVYSVDASTLMVASQEEEILWVLDLVGQEEADGLHGLLPSVYVVPQEQVVGVWWEGAILKQPQQVRVLAMDVAYKWTEGVVCWGVSEREEEVM